MKAPQLTRRLVLEAPVRAPDGAGGYVPGWTALGVLWAEVVAGAGREAAGLAGPVSRSSYRITVRAAPVGSSRRPVADQRLRDGDRVFRVLAVSERDRAGRYLLCSVQEEVAA